MKLISIHFSLAVCRFFHDLSAMFLWGAFGYLWAFVPPNLAMAIARKLSGIRIAAIAVTFVTMVLTLFFETAMIGGSWPAAFDLRTLSAILFKTSVDQAWIANALASTLLAGTLILQRRRHAAAVTVASGLVLASLVMTGHAMKDEGLLGYFHQANDLVHILASGAWIGALLPLASVMKGFADPASFRCRKLALERFSNAGMVAVALTVFSGTANTLLVVGHLPTDWSSPYQVMLASKILLVIGMIGLAITNRYRSSRTFMKDPACAASTIRKGILGEIVLSVFVIALVSIFGMLEPE